MYLLTQRTQGLPHKDLEETLTKRIQLQLEAITDQCSAFDLF